MAGLKGGAGSGCERSKKFGQKQDDTSTPYVAHTVSIILYVLLYV